MNMSGQEIVGWLVGVLTIGGAFVGLVRYLVTMKEQQRTLFKKIESIEKDSDSKDKAIAELRSHFDASIKDVRAHFDASVKEISQEFKNLNDSVRDYQVNSTKMIQDLHIEILNKLSEIRK